MSTNDNTYTPTQTRALRALRSRLRTAKYDWGVRQILKNTATATGITEQIQLVKWQDEEDNNKNLLHWLVEERVESRYMIPGVLGVRCSWFLVPPELMGFGSVARGS